MQDARLDQGQADATRLQTMIDAIRVSDTGDGTATRLDNQGVEEGSPETVASDVTDESPAPSSDPDDDAFARYRQELEDVASARLKAVQADLDTARERESQTQRNYDNLQPAYTRATQERSALHAENEALKRQTAAYDARLRKMEQLLGTETEDEESPVSPQSGTSEEIASLKAQLEQLTAAQAARAQQEAAMQQAQSSIDDVNTIARELYSVEVPGLNDDQRAFMTAWATAYLTGKTREASSLLASEARRQGVAKVAELRAKAAEQDVFAEVGAGGTKSRTPNGRAVKPKSLDEGIDWRASDKLSIPQQEEARLENMLRMRENL